MKPINQTSNNGAPGWPGPRYLRPNKRNSDLLFILRHLAVILKANASITSGLKAALEDHLQPSRLDTAFQSRARTYALLLVIFISWNTFPVWQLIAPSRDLIFNDITIAMILIEMAGLLVIGLKTWRERTSATSLPASSQPRNRVLKIGRWLDLLLFIALPLASGIVLSAALLLYEEPYFAGMSFLCVSLLTAALVNRMRATGMPAGPFTRFLLGQTFTGNKRIALLRGLGGILQQGATLGEAMKQLHNFFPPHVAGRICAAEQTGQLAPTMYSVIDELEAEIKHQDRRAGKYIYLGIVLALQILLIIFIATKILPVFAEILSDFGSENTGPMRSLVKIGDFLIYKWPSLLIAVSMTVIIIVVLYRHVPSAKWLWSRLLLSLPVAGALQRYRNASRISRTLGDLLEGGVPLHESLEICAASGVGPAHARLLRQWKPLAERGESLAHCAQTIASPAIIPGGFAAAAQLGESSGAPRAALHHAADCYSDCAQRAAAAFDAISYPVLLAPLCFVTYLLTTAIYSTLAGFSDALFYSL